MPTPKKRTPADIALDMSNPQHSRAYLVAAEAFLSHWPVKWSGKELRDVITVSDSGPDAEDNYAKGYQVAARIGTMEAARVAGSDCFPYAADRIETATRSILHFAESEIRDALGAQEEPLKAFLVSVDVRFDNKVTRRKHVIRARDTAAADTEAYRIESTIVESLPCAKDYSFYASPPIEINPKDLPAILRYF